VRFIYLFSFWLIFSTYGNGLYWVKHEQNVKRELQMKVTDHVLGHEDKKTWRISGFLGCCAMYCGGWTPPFRRTALSPHYMGQ
jgi:hypothetical protein